MWYGDETVGFCRRDTRVITDGCSLLRGCWNAFFKNMLFKRGSLSESQMAASPTGNIRSFCSEDALGWLIQTSKNKKLWWGFFFFFYPLLACESKASNVTWGFWGGTPTGSFKLGEKPALCFIDSPPFWSLETIERLNISSAPHVWTESCTPVLAVSLQTCPTADINKVIIWGRQDSRGWRGGGGVPSALEWSSDRTEWKFKLSCFIVLWGKTIVCLWMLLQSFMGSLVLLVGAAGCYWCWCCWWVFLFCFVFPTSTTLCFFQYRTCKWEFMFSATMRYGRWILKADRLKYIQFARSKFRSSFTGVQDFQSWALPEEETLLGARAVRASLRRNAARPSRAAQCRWRRRRLQYLASLPPRALIWLFPLALRLRCEASEGASEGGAVSRCALPRDRVRLNYANRIQKWNQQQLMWNGCVNKVSAFTGRLC